MKLILTGIPGNENSRHSLGLGGQKCLYLNSKLAAAAATLSLCCNNSPALHASKIHKLIPFLSKVGSLIKWFLRFEQWDTIYLFVDSPHIFNVTFNGMMKHISPHPQF